QWAPSRRHRLGIDTDIRTDIMTICLRGRAEVTELRDPRAHHPAGGQGLSVRLEPLDVTTSGSRRTRQASRPSRSRQRGLNQSPGQVED
ncbi:MAG: hypothetical protein M3Q18_04470, partial [Actinomycetota bacterium]|nr:hypothetical protein [Actinomycetota bacterium]